ncbi:KEOPS complex subunit Cgi121 [Haladaptatus litoreus]|uniref:KEOPS complex subunit Cgi121 n=1 Tax=Haladaptatus litoreus TaxID=553468 RepID=A0A1N7BY65_9EURY|nr:KEOPS complex subunit Cgi121 [Haladaptatus litoreus]SIR56279.1 KEOPS complex subunit Cgi121 [Haladaptatus litoreus]
MKLVEGVANIDDLDTFLGQIGDIADEYNCAIQAFDARYIAGRDHLKSAVEHANRAFDRGENVARDRAVEILLYAAGRRQINQALEMGVSEGKQQVIVVVDGKQEADENKGVAAISDLLKPADTLGNPDREMIFDFFDVSDRELNATSTTLSDLVCERVALLEVEK